MGARWVATIGVFALGVPLGACAPRPLAAPALSVSAVVDRYRVMLAAREQRCVAVEADVAVWTRLANQRRVPGVQGALWLAAPDAFRLRVGSVFGTALDVAAWGDSAMLYVPSRRAFAQVDAALDSIGVREPGAWVVRLWSGTWRAPAAAFDRGEIEGGLRVARWIERGDSLALAVDGEGLPAWLSIGRSAGMLRVKYPEWGGWEGIKWPARIEVRESGDRVRFTCRVQRVRFLDQLEPGRLVLRPPGDAERYDWKELRSEMER